MTQSDRILKRIEYLQAELQALAKLVAIADLDGLSVPEAPSAPQVAAPVAAAPAAPAEVPEKKLRWRYVPGTWYRIVGPNPFRNGNNDNLFAHLAERYGGQPFSREQLSEAIATLSRAGRIQTEQDEESFVRVFLSIGGASKGRIAMVEAPRTPPPAKAEPSELPPEPGDVRWQLVGSPTFRPGSINHAIWHAVGGAPFSKDDLEAHVGRLVSSGKVESSRPAAVIARDFLGLVVDRGLAGKL